MLGGMCVTMNRARLGCLLAAALLLAAMPVAAGDETAAAPLQAGQQLLGEVQDFAGELFAARAAPPRTQLQVLLSLRPDRRFSLHAVTVSIDGQQRVHHRYSATEIAALAAGAAQPLLVLHLPPGEHRLGASWEGEAPRSDQLQRGLEWRFRSGDGRRVVELQLGMGAEDGLPHFASKVWE